MKICLIGDLHYGEKGNSDKFNQQVNDLLRFAVDESKKRTVEMCIQLGDWHDDRSKLNVATINRSIEGAKILQEGFDTVYTIVSNHDIYHRDRLDVNSMKLIEPYITVVDQPTIIENFIMVPWVVSNEMWDEVINLTHESKVDYMFAHLELNGFLVNDMYEMEHGYSPTSLRHLKHVYTGHYHSPQTKDNITYTGTPYPISMNEANGTHGIYFFDTETGDCEFVEYTKVKVLSINYDELDVLDECDPQHTTVRVVFPDNLEDETVITDVQNFLKEKGFDDHKIRYTDKKATAIMESDVGEVEEVENIDGVVINFLKTSKPIDGVDLELLASIYQDAIKNGEQNA